MDRPSFDEVVREALDELPTWASEALVNVAVLVAEEDPDDPDLYGAYDGIPLPERTGEPVEPARILIFRRPLVEDFPARRDLRDEIRITVLHEVAHHFGIDDDRLDELGFG